MVKILRTKELYSIKAIRKQLQSQRKVRNIGQIKCKRRLDFDMKIINTNVLVHKCEEHVKRETK